MKAQLPGFLVVGAARCATTALYAALSRHPGLFLNSHVKETHFLADIQALETGRKFHPRVTRTLEEYRALFRGDDGRLAGEVCPSYLYYHANTLRNVERYLDEGVKVIVCLRNPVERAFSNYLLHVCNGWEKLAFEDALACEKERIGKGWWWGFHYAAVSRYHEALANYYQHVGRGRMLVMVYEKFSAHPEEELRGVCRFLGVSADCQLYDGIFRNVGRKQRTPEWLGTLAGHPTLRRVRQTIPVRIHRALSGSGIGAAAQLADVPHVERKRLMEEFEKEVGDLERLTGLPLRQEWGFRSDRHAPSDL
jgi:hypothetical protein